MALSSARLRKLLDYNPKTGLITWLRPNARNIAPGQRAGRLNTDGYIGIRVDYTRYTAGRLAWLYVYGKWPSAQIDHINGDRADNRIANLRLATATQNQGNKKGTNRHGLKGISFYKKRFAASIKIKRQTIYLGRFDTAQQAHTAYLAAARKHFGAEFVKSY
jgi:hypothetical protein